MFVDMGIERVRGGGSYIYVPPVYLDKIKIVKKEMCQIVIPRAKRIKKIFLLRKKLTLNA
jgi:hypothetical protein